MRFSISASLLLAAAAAAQAPALPKQNPLPNQDGGPGRTARAAEPPPALEHIEASRLLEHARYLASDELEGRLTGTPGQEAAARYIAAHFAELGLEPLGDVVDEERTFLQRYGITRTSVGEGAKLQLGKLELRDGFAVLGGRPQQVDVTGTLRYCGLGRTRGPSADLPADASLEGQIAVAVLRGPRGRVKPNLTVEQKFMMSFGAFNQLNRTAQALANKDAAAVVFVQLQDPIGMSDVLNYLALSPGKPLLVPRFEGAEPGMSGLGMLGAGDGPPAFVLSVAASHALLAELGLAVDASGAVRTAGDGGGAAGTAVGGGGGADEGDEPQDDAEEVAAAAVVAREDVVGKITLDVVRDEHATACNVVAVLRGSDPQLAAEAIVFSAHMDHVGRRMDGEIFNGADDNASGSAGLLEIATAFARSQQKPKRSVVFLSVSGEELGLWGSQFFADNPTWPADKLIANVNTDMIGRSGPESGPQQVTVTPSHRHARYSTLVRDSARLAERLGISFESGDKYYERSDHYNFAKKGIPVVFFCNGEHEDYHQVTDHADKLDGDKMQRIARLAFWTGWQAANAEQAPRTIGRQEDW